MAINKEKLTQLIHYATGATSQIAQLKQQNADLSAELAIAKANDASDAQAIAEAQAEAEQAQAEAQVAKDAVAPLQAALDADVSEDEQVNALLDSLSLPVADTDQEPV